MRATLAALAIGALLSGCASSGPDEPAGDASPSVTAEAVAGEPVGVADVDGSPWVALVGTGQVRTGDGTTIDVGEAPLRIVDTPSGVWVSVIGDGRVVRIDPSSGRVDRRVRLRPAGSEPEGLAWDGASLWVVDQAGERVVQLDGDGRLQASYDVGQAPRLVATDDSGVWVTNYGGTSVSRVADGEVTTTPVVGCVGAQGVVAAAGKVWVTCTVSHKVVALDPQSMEQVAEVTDLPDADAVVADGSTVYVVGQSGPTVYAIDAGSAKLLSTTPLDDAAATQENVGAAIVGRDLVVTHPDTGLYSLPLG
jgi:outer membrane protein assembly factor BamB